MPAAGVAEVRGNWFKKIGEHPLQKTVLRNRFLKVVKMGKRNRGWASRGTSSRPKGGREQ